MACSKRMASCPVLCLHKQSVTNYHAAREHDERVREDVTAMYSTEMAEYTGPMMTFRQWLVGGRLA